MTLVKPPLKTYLLRWAPTAEKIAVVRAGSRREAIRKAPQPYRQYLGEIYAEQSDAEE